MVVHIMIVFTFFFSATDLLKANGYLAVYLEVYR